MWKTISASIWLELPKIHQNFPDLRTALYKTYVQYTYVYMIKYVFIKIYHLNHKNFKYSIIVIALAIVICDVL